MVGNLAMPLVEWQRHRSDLSWLVKSEKDRYTPIRRHKSSQIQLLYCLKNGVRRGHHVVPGQRKEDRATHGTESRLRDPSEAHPEQHRALGGRQRYATRLLRRGLYQGGTGQRGETYPSPIWSQAVG